MENARWQLIRLGSHRLPITTDTRKIYIVFRKGNHVQNTCKGNLKSIFFYFYSLVGGVEQELFM